MHVCSHTGHVCEAPALNMGNGRNEADGVLEMHAQFEIWVHLKIGDCQ